MATTARIGRTSGKMIRQKISQSDAPSMRADSSSSRGIESKKPFISHVLIPSAPPRYTRISPPCEFSPKDGMCVPMVWTSRNVATIVSELGKTCTRKMVSIRLRRPANRKRENAYAPSAHTNTVRTAVMTDTLIEFHIQVANGCTSLSSRVR